jgi:hypothetical protein
MGSEVELARFEMLAALIMDFHRSDTGDYTTSALKARYGLKSSVLLLEGSLGWLEQKGWVGVDRSLPSFQSRLKVAHYGQALEEFLERIDGNSFDVSWQYGRVTTDARLSANIPVPFGWLIMDFEPTAPRPSEKKVMNELPIIQNNVNVSPIINNTVSQPSSENSEQTALARSGARAGWANALIALLVGGVVVIVTLWASGKL